jgi:hypothetical protein
MRTQMSETSLDAYRSLPIRSLCKSESEVMDLMRDGKPRTRRMIADELGWRDGPTCGRCNSLVASGRLIEQGEYKDPITKKYSALLHLPTGQMRLL